MDFEEILKDPKYQAAFDAKITKALDTAKKKWDEDAEAARKELEENAKLTAEERIKKDMEKLAKENAELKSNAAKRAMKDRSLEYIKSRGYSSTIEDLVDLSSFANEKEMQSNIDNLNTKLSNTVSKELDNKLRENGYPDLASKVQGSNDLFNFGFTSIK